MQSLLVRIVVALSLALFFITEMPVNALRMFRQRRDMQDLPSLSSLDLHVPLQGGRTCNVAEFCVDKLPVPPTSRILHYVAIARGTLTYTCSSQDPFKAPIYTSQNTNLYDAIPLIVALGTEAQFHAIIPEFLEYDYVSLENSTLTCIGNIATHQGINVVDLFSKEVFPVELLEKIHAPSGPEQDLDWAHTQSNDKRWDIYRVVTAGGVPPVACHEQNKKIERDYAAEYWFFHQ